MLARSANDAIILQEKKMRIETNIKIIEQLSMRRKDANWTFRFFLKGPDVSAARIDSIVHYLYKEC